MRSDKDTCGARGESSVKLGVRSPTVREGLIGTKPLLTRGLLTRQTKVELSTRFDYNNHKVECQLTVHQQNRPRKLASNALLSVQIERRKSWPCALRLPESQRSIPPGGMQTSWRDQSRLTRRRCL